MDFKKLINNKLWIFIFVVFISVIANYISGVFLASSLLYPDVAISPIIGLIFGPYGALGSAVCNFYFDVFDSNLSLFVSLVDLLTVFLISYVPYKLWYSSFMDKVNNVLRLNSTHNLIKFIVIMGIDALIYFVFYGLLYEEIFNLKIASLYSFVLTLNFFNFSIIIGMIFLLVLSFLGISFYPPKNSPKLKKFRISSKVANVLLIFSICFAFVHVFLNLFFQFDIDGLVVGLLTYVPVILFLFKPFNEDISYSSYKQVVIERIKIKNFNASLIEKLIIIFLILDMGILLLLIIAYEIGMLVDLFDSNLSLLLYMDVVFILFFFPSILFLRYMERNITKPLEYISNSVKNYINGTNVSKSTDELVNTYKDYLSQGTEIGNLSRSLTKMTKDLENYVKEVKALSSEKERFKTELAIAKKIQESFIPQNFEVVRDLGVDIAGLMIPAKEVGGDFYDFFMVDDNHLAIVIGDVSDKGVPASLFMVVTKTLIQEYSYLIDNPSEIFSKVNNSLCKNNDENMFVTGWMGILELDSGEFNFVNAGHEPPLLISFSENKGYHWLKTKPGFVLGGFEGINYKLNKIKLKSGDKIILYTDGVTEANNSYEGFFGEDGLLNAVSESENLSVAEELDFIKNEIYKFTGGTEQFDDITLLMMEYNKKD